MSNAEGPGSCNTTSATGARRATSTASARTRGDVDGIGPYPLQVGTARVTDEAAPVTLLEPEHALWRAPNEIGEADFRGWVQERGLYFAAGWDARYTALAECHDPGEEPQRGALLYARYGAGVYIFTAFSWFRQLPAGVPGAYRIFANLVSARQT